MATTQIPTAYRPHEEIYRFPPWLPAAVVLGAILAQTQLPDYYGFLKLLDLPLLAVIYFGFSRRNPSTGLLLGAFVGLFQDALGPAENYYIGLLGIAKTVVGYLASSLTSRVDTDSPAARAVLIFVLFLLHNFIYAGTQRLLPDMNIQTPLLDWAVLKMALINPIVGVVAFWQIDRFRRSH